MIVSCRGVDYYFGPSVPQDLRLDVIQTVSTSRERPHHCAQISQTL